MTDHLGTPDVISADVPADIRENIAAGTMGMRELYYTGQLPFKPKRILTESAVLDTSSISDVEGVV